MPRSRVRTAAPLVLVAVLAVLAGGVAAIGIGKAAGWLDGAETIVLRPAEPMTLPQPIPAAAGAAPTGASFDPGAVYRERSSGVVTIYAILPEPGAEGSAQAQGSGFVVSSRGHVLTNSHVITTAGDGAPGTKVEAASAVFVEFSDGTRAPAEVVGWDAFSDVGVLWVNPADHALVPVPLGDSSRVAVGEPVAAIGSPFGQSSSLTVGVVSAVQRAVSSLTSPYSVIDAIQTDAPINRGNSGGPLFNARGEVIGINAQIRSESGNAEGVGFAIPVNTARRSMEQLVATGHVRYAWVGVSTQTITASMADELGYAEGGGAAIQSVVPGSPAERAGLRAGGMRVSLDGLDFRRGGDVVVAVDGVPVRTTEELIRIVTGELSPGDTVALGVLRDGERITVSVTLAERPEDPDAAR